MEMKEFNDSKEFNEFEESHQYQRLELPSESVNLQNHEQQSLVVIDENQELNWQSVSALEQQISSFLTDINFFPRLGYSISSTVAFYAAEFSPQNVYQETYNKNIRECMVEHPSHGRAQSAFFESSYSNTTLMLIPVLNFVGGYCLQFPNLRAWNNPRPISFINNVARTSYTVIINGALFGINWCVFDTLFDKPRLQAIEDSSRNCSDGIKFGELPSSSGFGLLNNAVIVSFIVFSIPLLPTMVCESYNSLKRYVNQCVNDCVNHCATSIHRFFSRGGRSNQAVAEPSRQQFEQPLVPSNMRQSNS